MIKQIFTKPRIIILIVFLLLALVAIHPNFSNEGVVVRNVLRNSSASLAGIESPTPTTTPMARERITSINNVVIKDMDDYYEAVEGMQYNRTYKFSTTKGVYYITPKPITDVEELNETENITRPVVVQENVSVNGTWTLMNVTKNETVEVPKTITHILGTADIGLRVSEAPTTNLRKGLDLQGGTRVLLQPEEEVSPEDMSLIISNLQERLNVYGLSDVVVRESGDLSGNSYILVEIAGANDEEIRELLAKQGKFEATIGNQTVFKGGEDITYVCRSAECSGIDPQRGCGQASADQWSCRFRFSISLTPAAAARQADLTKDLTVETDDSGYGYLSQSLDLYLDDSLVDSLRIAEDLKGVAATEISITGSGIGPSREAAVFDALNNMKRLQTILVTGSLPVSLDVVKSDSISPVLGEEFLKNSLLIGLLAILSVSVVVSVRYRNLKITLPIIITMMSEVILLLGLAALIGWNLDLAAIAGIIIAVGTGVDDQIVITDETLKGEKSTSSNWKARFKKAFFIIMAAYATTVAAMLPLWFAGAGLLKGFAITTIFGVTFGVFITRPAFAVMIEQLLRD